MKHLDLFSGIGGFSLAADRVWPGIEHTFVEIDPFCRAVLQKHWPNAHIHDDIKTFKGNKAETVDLVTGGFPCQPFSTAGKRRGTEDDRHLWPEMLRIIQETKPNWIIGENVIGIVTMGLKEVLADLESIGYGCQAFCIPACAVAAPHRRERIWIVAHSGRIGRNRLGEGGKEEYANLNLEEFAEWERFETGLLLDVDGFFSGPVGGVIRNDDGLSEGMDRLKALGNAIVPQVAEEIMRAIRYADENHS